MNSVLNPLLLISYFLGLPTLKLNVFKIVLIILYSIITFVELRGLKNDPYKPVLDNLVTNFGYYFKLLGQITSFYLIHIFNHLNSKKIVLLLNQVFNLTKNIDKATKRLILSVQLNYFFISLILLFVSYIKFTLFKDTYLIPLNNYKFILYFFPQIFLLVTEAQFSVTIYCLYCLLMHHKKQFIIYNNKNHEEVPYKINELIKINFKLHDLAALANKVYSKQIITGLMMRFTFILYSTFYGYYYMDFSYKATLVWIMFFFVNAYPTIIIAYISEKIIKAIKDYELLINKLLNNDNNPILQEKLMLYAKHFSGQKFTVSGCGLFEFDGSLIFMFISAGATFLLIMVQFLDTSESYCKLYTQTEELVQKNATI